MEQSKMDEIKRLAEIAFEKREAWNCARMMNTPSEYEARKAAAIRYAVIEAEMYEAQAALDKAKSF